MQCRTRMQITGHHSRSAQTRSSMSFNGLELRLELGLELRLEFELERKPRVSSWAN